jgi:hypothetical protein
MAHEVESLHRCQVVSHDHNVKFHYYLSACIDVETRDEDDRVRCRLCLEYSRKDYKGIWVLRRGLSGHEKLACHAKAVQADEAHSRAQVQERLDTAKATMRSNSIWNSNQQKSTKPSQEEQAVWDDLGNIDDHDYGQSPVDVIDERRMEFLKKLDEYGLWEGDETPFHDEMENIAQAWEIAEHEQMLDEILQDIGSLSSLIIGKNTYFYFIELDSLDNEGTPNVNSTTGWYPYPSKLTFLLDTIDNLPRLRISSLLMKVILWLLQEIGVTTVPSFARLRSIQKQINQEQIVRTVQWMSPKGNAYSFNDPTAIIANVSFSNLKTSGE